MQIVNKYLVWGIKLNFMSKEEYKSTFKKKIIIIKEEPDKSNLSTDLLYIVKFTPPETPHWNCIILNLALRKTILGNCSEQELIRHMCLSTILYIYICYSYCYTQQ